jgi:hypothetical protein
MNLPPTTIVTDLQSLVSSYKRVSAPVRGPEALVWQTIIYELGMLLSREDKRIDDMLEDTYRSFGGE